MCLWGVCGKGDGFCPLDYCAGRVDLQGINKIQVPVYFVQLLRCMSEKRGKMCGKCR